MKRNMKSIFLAAVAAFALAVPSIQAKEKNEVNDPFLTMILVKGDSVKGSLKYNSNIFRDGETITMPDYYIGKFEVTQELYSRVMLNSDLKLNPTPFNNPGKDLPAECMTWLDAIYFCNRLSEMSKLSPVYSMQDVKVEKGHIVKAKVFVDTTKNGYRLPTEQEWEYAARGGDKMKKDLYAGSDDVNDVAWTKANAGDKTHPIGTREPNSIGIYDMSGNVWEYVWDSYGVNTLGSTTEIHFRVIKGGGWWNYVNFATVSANFIWLENDGDGDLGFRVVRNIR